jgi:hypothetical protein
MKTNFYAPTEADRETVRRIREYLAQLKRAPEPKTTPPAVKPVVPLRIAS